MKARLPEQIEQGDDIFFLRGREYVRCKRHWPRPHWVQDSDFSLDDAIDIIYPEQPPRSTKKIESIDSLI